MNIFVLKILNEEKNLYGRFVVVQLVYNISINYYFMIFYYLHRSLAPRTNTRKQHTNTTK